MALKLRHVHRLKKKKIKTKQKRILNKFRKKKNIANKPDHICSYLLFNVKYMWVWLVLWGLVVFKKNCVCGRLDIRIKCVKFIKYDIITKRECCSRRFTENQLYHNMNYSTLTVIYYNMYNCKYCSTNIEFSFLTTVWPRRYTIIIY